MDGFEWWMKYKRWCFGEQLRSFWAWETGIHLPILTDATGFLPWEGARRNLICNLIGNMEGADCPDHLVVGRREHGCPLGSWFPWLRSCPSMSSQVTPLNSYNFLCQVIYQTTCLPTLPHTQAPRHPGRGATRHAQIRYYDTLVGPRSALGALGSCPRPPSILCPFCHTITSPPSHRRCSKDRGMTGFRFGPSGAGSVSPSGK